MGVIDLPWNKMSTTGINISVTENDPYYDDFGSGVTYVVIPPLENIYDSSNGFTTLEVRVDELRKGGRKIGKYSILQFKILWDRQGAKYTTLSNGKEAVPTIDDITISKRYNLPLTDVNQAKSNFNYLLSIPDTPAETAIGLIQETCNKFSYGIGNSIAESIYSRYRGKKIDNISSLLGMSNIGDTRLKNIIISFSNLREATIDSYLASNYTLEESNFLDYLGYWSNMIKPTSNGQWSKTDNYVAIEAMNSAGTGYFERAVKDSHSELAPEIKLDKTIDIPFQDWNDFYPDNFVDKNGFIDDNEKRPKEVIINKNGIRKSVKVEECRSAVFSGYTLDPKTRYAACTNWLLIYNRLRQKSLAEEKDHKAASAARQYLDVRSAFLRLIVISKGVTALNENEARKKLKKFQLHSYKFYVDPVTGTVMHNQAGVVGTSSELKNVHHHLGMYLGLSVYYNCSFWKSRFFDKWGYMVILKKAKITLAKLRKKHIEKIDREFGNIRKYYNYKEKYENGALRIVVRRIHKKFLKLYRTEKKLDKLWIDLLDLLQDRHYCPPKGYTLKRVNKLKRRLAEMAKTLRAIDQAEARNIDQTIGKINRFIFVTQVIKSSSELIISLHPKVKLAYKMIFAALSQTVEGLMRRDSKYMIMLRATLAPLLATFKGEKLKKVMEEILKSMAEAISEASRETTIDRMKKTFYKVFIKKLVGSGLQATARTRLAEFFIGIGWEIIALTIENIKK